MIWLHADIEEVSMMVDQGYKLDPITHEGESLGVVPEHHRDTYTYLTKTIQKAEQEKAIKHATVLSLRQWFVSLRSELQISDDVLSFAILPNWEIITSYTASKSDY